MTIRGDDYPWPFERPYDRDKFQKLLETAVLIQSRLSSLVLSSGMAISFHAGHRVPKVAVFIGKDVIDMLDEIHCTLSFCGHWRRVGYVPFMARGFLNGVEIHIMSDYGRLPEKWPGKSKTIIDPPLYGPARIFFESPPWDVTNYEMNDHRRLNMLSLESVFKLALTNMSMRRSLRDFIDVAALSDALLDEQKNPAKLVADLPLWLPKRNNLLKNILYDLANPVPRGTEHSSMDSVLAGYKGFRAPYNSWPEISSKLTKLQENAISIIKEKVSERKADKEIQN